jgi:thiol:disulfide interchange protein
MRFKNTTPRHCLLLMLLVALAPGCEISDEQAMQADTKAGVESSEPAAASSAARKPTQVARGSLKFIEGYQRGYEQALREGKPMLVFFTAEWCHYCHQMANEAFTHPQVVGLADRFVCILVDADAEGEVCEKFRVQGYPTIQFLSPRGVPLNRIVGKKPGHQVMMAMQSALQNVARHAEAGESQIR